MVDFIGREDELKFLVGLFKKKNASLIVIRGRRRIGKSRLVEEFGKEYTFYRFSGIPPTASTTAQSQRDEFANQLGNVTGITGIKSDDWNSLFILLGREAQKRVLSRLQFESLLCVSFLKNFKFQT